MSQVQEIPAALEEERGAFSEEAAVKLPGEGIGHPWQYHFYLDLQASSSDPQVVAARGEFDHCADDERGLGCYTVARTFINETDQTEKGAEP